MGKKPEAPRSGQAEYPPPSPKSPLALSLVTLFLAYHWGKPERPEVSGPRRVRRSDKAGPEAVRGDAGGDQSRVAAPLVGRSPRGGSGGRAGRGSGSKA